MGSSSEHAADGFTLPSVAIQAIGEFSQKLLSAEIEDAASPIVIYPAVGDHPLPRRQFWRYAVRQLILATCLTVVPLAAHADPIPIPVEFFISLADDGTGGRTVLLDPGTGETTLALWSYAGEAGGGRGHILDAGRVVQRDRGHRDRELLLRAHGLLRGASPLELTPHEISISLAEMKVRPEISRRS